MYDKLKRGGGCAAKLPIRTLRDVLDTVPTITNENLIVGFETSDDAAVFKLKEDIAIINTLDFFPPVVDDPYTFGKIAAANALSDIYAMGGDVLLALNIVCFPATDDVKQLSEILRGGAEKVMEAGGILCGGHSIRDESVKYGLSVTGTIDPLKVYKNNGCKIGDDIIITKPLGIGIINAAYGKFEEKNETYLKAISVMETLNKTACEISKNFDISACTDITGFGLLGHLNEMSTDNYTIIVDSKSIPYISGVYEYAKNSIVTGAASKNRAYLKNKVNFKINDTALEEILIDPQTSGGLCFSVSENQSSKLLSKLKENGVEASIIAKVSKREDTNIVVI
ncbi:MAG: selenide, water dikinase SelD [Defluviitaleaceae bacterium]|nr:selenide, water dikinase SelD [Defluviitaleaceae bacterium]